MASAMLVSRNETSNFLSPNHHQPPRPTTTTTTTNFMGKIPFLNPNPNPNFNNNNHNFSRKQLSHQNGGQFHGNHTPDDASSLNHHHHNHQIQHLQNHRKLSNDVGGNGNGNGSGVGVSLSHYVNYDISALSKAELRSLKTRLMSELDRVRSLSTRIESGDFRSGPAKKRPLPFQPPYLPKRGKNQNQNQNQSHSQHQHQHQHQPASAYVASGQVMKMCEQVLTKVMKQKAGYVFNEPVDVVGMGLHDYHQIIKRPMDLGTIKKNLVERFYNTPDEFAADVRLTFNNALMYNPKGHEVHTLADKFLAKFEQYFRPVSQKFLLEKHHSLRQHATPPPPPPQLQPKQHKVMEIRPKDDAVVVVDEVQGSSWSKNPSPEPPPPPPPKVVEVPPKKPEPRPEPRVEPPPRIERVEPRVEQVPQQPPPQPPLRPEPVAELVQTPVQEAVRSGTGRGSSGKLPKPKAKDPNKREMNMEEKHKLGAGLQSLPEEKMSQVIQIIRKRNGHLTQDGDEIELDIEAVDTETLWELDRFVTNYKKMVSKLRRQALMDMQNNNVGHNDDSNQVGLSERMMVDTSKAAKRGGGGDVGEEDVDIGDEMPVHNFPPVEIDKDDDRHPAGGGGGGGAGGGGGGESSDSSSSSSSGSDSSSSSDSDSGSSSGSDSDVDDAQSRDNESKNIPR